jgi:hypothetical protein
MASPPVNLPTSLPNFGPIKPDYIISADFDKNPEGGSFSLTYILTDETPETLFTENSYVSIGNYSVFVEDVVKNVAVGGRTVTISGRMFNPDMLQVTSRWYVNQTEFASIGRIPHVNQPEDFVANGPVTYIANMGFKSLASRICADCGVNYFFHGVGIDYKIYSYAFDSSQGIVQQLTALANEAGFSVIVDYSGSIRFVEYGGATTTVPAVSDDITVSLSTSYDKPFFNNVIVNGGTDMVPWNSVYVGLPKKIASVNFEAGPIATKDISYGSGVVQPSKDWVFPEIAGNDWVDLGISFSADFSADKPIYNYLTNSLGLKGVWDYKVIAEGTIDYQALMLDIKGTSVTATKYGTSLSSYSSKYVQTTPRYLALTRWNYAYTTVSNNADIFPVLWALPSDQAPDTGGIGMFDLQDNQDITINGYMSVSGNADVYAQQASIAGIPGLPQELSGITPSGYGFYARDNDGNIGFNEDGSFSFSITVNTPKTQKKKITNQRQTTPVNRALGFYTEAFQNAVFTAGSKTFEVTYANFANLDTGKANLAAHLRDVMNRTHADAVICSTGGWPDGSQTIPLKGPSISIPSNVITGIFPGGKDYDFYQANAIRISEILPVNDSDGNPIPTKARITLVSPSRFSGTYKFAFFVPVFASTTSPTGTQGVSADATYNEYFTDSGTVEENSEPIKGSWSIYGLERKTFRAVCVDGRTFYFGISTEKDAQALATLETYKTKRTKSVNLTYLTDTLGTNSELVRFTNFMKQYIGLTFKRTSRSFPLQNIGQVPDIGAAFGSDGVVVSTSVNISSSGMFCTVNCGALPAI